ncbi:MAG: endolytic transglycosylase MltG [Pleomorphochaeta sp.]
MKETENNNNVKKMESSSKESLVNERARERIEGSVKKRAKKPITKVDTKAKKNIKKSEDNSYIDVPSRKSVRGIPSAKLDVFNTSTKDTTKSTPSNKTKSSTSTEKKAVKKDVKTTSTEKKAKDSITSKKSDKTSISNKNTSNKKSSLSTSKKTDLNLKGTTSSITKKASTSKDKKSIDSVSSRKVNKKDEKRPLYREKTRPTKRPVNQNAKQNSSKTISKVKSTKSTAYINNKDKETKKSNTDKKKTLSTTTNNKKTKGSISKSSQAKKKGNKSKNSDSLNKIIELMNSKQSSTDKALEASMSIKKKRQRRLTNAQLNERAQINKEKKSLMYKILNYRINARFNFRFIYLILLIIVLALFIAVNFFFFDFNLFVDNAKITLSNELKREIVQPIHEDYIEPEFIFVGENLEDISALQISENKNNNINEVNHIINIENEELNDNYIKIIIDNGLSATQIASLLEENGVCDKEEFLNYVVENGYDTKLRSGVYIIDKNSSIEDIVNSIIEIDQTILTFYPASTIDQIDQMLTSRNLIDSGDFYDACVNVCAQKGFDFVEGWFTPATYKITNDFDVNLLALTMVDNTLSTLSPYVNDIARMGYSINDIVIIASLIQAETQNVEQMPIISSVIHNRLEKDMPLGIDATTRYEMGNWTSKLTSEDFEELTPYNTRRVKGLPPSGICLSSKEALISAIFPKDTNYLYYIHNQAGQLIPALTYEEHLNNIEERDNS